MATTTSDVSRRTLVKVGGGFAVAAVLLYLLGRVVGWGEILAAVGRADPLWLVAAMASTTAGLVAWTRVWDDVLSALAVDVPFPSLTMTYFAATFADYVTPAGKVGGGPIIAYLLSTDERVTYHEGLASVTTTDLLNVLPLFLFAAVGTVGLLVRGTLPPRADLFVVAIAGFAAAVALVVAFVAWRRADVEDAAVSVLRPVARALPFVEPSTVEGEVREFSTQIGRIAERPRLLVGTLAYSLVGWVLFAAPLYLAARSLGVSLYPPLVLFIIPASTLAGLVPTPGGLGSVEFAVTGLLVALAPLDAGSAAAVTLLYRVANYWFVVVVGGSFTLYEIYSV